MDTLVPSIVERIFVWLVRTVNPFAPPSSETGSSREYIFHTSSQEEVFAEILLAIRIRCREVGVVIFGHSGRDGTIHRRILSVHRNLFSS